MKKTLLLLCFIPFFSHAQTIGDNTVGGGVDNWSANNAVCTEAVAPAGMTEVDSLSLYVTSADNVKLAIWTYPALSFIASTNSFFPAGGWNTQNLTVPAAVTAGATYCIGLVANSSALHFAIKAAPYVSHLDGSNSFSSPISFASNTTLNNYGLSEYGVQNSSQNQPYSTTTYPFYDNVATIFGNLTFLDIHDADNFLTSIPPLMAGLFLAALPVLTTWQGLLFIVLFGLGLLGWAFKLAFKRKLR